jgi:aminoglycoside/choline kinase family phosphotransferase
MPFELDVSALQRLEKFLQNKNQPREITLLTPDASVREYFRVRWNNRTAIACVYPEPFDAREQTYLDVTRLFRESDLPVAEIYDYDESAAVIVQEDLGDVILRSVLEQAEYAQKNELLNRAILLIAKIQAATPRAFALDSIASRLKFDREKLGWELDFFKTHYFETYLKKQLTVKENKNLTVEFAELVAELENRAEVLCHRDFHAANLMIDTRGDLRIIDHQDARIGAASYDLVSILLDRILEEPSIAWLREKRLFFLEEREKAGLKHIDPDDFALEFRLQTIQRCLKAIGTFSYQSVNRGKKHFIQYIEPMFRVVLQAARRLERFPHLQIIIERQLNEKSI